MELFLLRHGDAVIQAPQDRNRPLSPIGIQQVNQVMESCGKELASVQSILVSPYLRAQQTYREASRFLPNIKKQDHLGITPEGNPHQLIDQLYAMATSGGVSSILIISHQPLLGTLLELLCGFEPGAHRMGTSSLAAIDMDLPGLAMGELRWLKHPEIN